MIENEELDQWISKFHPTVETDVLEVLRSRVQYAILDQLNYMISGQMGSTEEIKKIILQEIIEIINESVEIDVDQA
jgi:ATP:corrinoid adenosyltransferase